MKKLIWMATIVIAGALALPAQQGRGGKPLAFNDQDKDGICDVTGKPVGQGRAEMQAGGNQQMVYGRGCRGMGGRGQGRGMARAGRMGQGRGMGRMGGGRGWQNWKQATPQAVTPAEPEASESSQ